MKPCCGCWRVLKFRPLPATPASTCAVWKAAVGTLEGSQLAEVAAQARQAEQALAGGQSRVVISTTMIIIALLVLILIIVAVD